MVRPAAPPRHPSSGPIYTWDLSARPGHATATDHDKARKYVGYEIHIAAQIPDRVWTDQVLNFRQGPAVPALITNVTLTPAGSHRANAIVPALIAAKKAGQALDEVIADPGYSMGTPDTYQLPLRAAGIKTLHKPVTSQRPSDPNFPLDAVVYDDTLLHPAVPPKVRAQQVARPGPNGTTITEEQPLPYPEYGDDAAQRAACQQPFNQRAIWRWRLVKIEHGYYWFRCPFCAGALSATNTKITSQRTPGPKAKPVSRAMRHHTKCCDGLMKIRPDQLGRWQDIVSCRV